MAALLKADSIGGMVDLIPQDPRLRLIIPRGGFLNGLGIVLLLLGFASFLAASGGSAGAGEIGLLLVSLAAGLLFWAQMQSYLHAIEAKQLLLLRAMLPPDKLPPPAPAEPVWD